MDKKEFEYRKELEELKHSNKMEEIKFEKECKLEVEKSHHEKEMERQRIKGAEIRKSQERRMNRNFMESYHKNGN